MVLATILGAGSVLLFAAGGAATVVALHWSETERLLWDAGLSLAFFLQHSGMVRRSFHARIARVIPDRYQGAVYAIASGIVLALVALLWQRSDTVLLRLEGIPLWIAYGGAAIAMAILFWSVLALRSFDPLGLAPIRAHLRQEPVRSLPFTVRGPYRWVRHPIYSGILLLFWCTPVLTADRLLFNILWSGWMIVGTFLEERDLTAHFGDAYRYYQQRVPMLIPYRGPMAT
jgi:methanethiol S-methyltransferase